MIMRLLGLTHATASKAVRLSETLMLFSVKKEFCRCGLLQQLQGAIRRCLHGTSRHSVIIRKMLRAAEVLPFTADDFHSMRSGQGSFADLLKTLTGFPEREVRGFGLHNMLAAVRGLLCQASYA